VYALDPGLSRKCGDEQGNQQEDTMDDQISHGSFGFCKVGNATQLRITAYVDEKQSEKKYGWQLRRT
jgi:hypothetical protein